MCGRSILSICFVLLLALSGNARAEDLDPPDFAGAEQTGVVFWEFQEDSDQPTSSIYDPPYMYDPELVDPVFGFRYYSGAWQWQQGAGINGDGAMLMVDEESVVQPVPAGDGANLTEYVQVTWQGPGPFGIGLEIWGGGEDWPGGVEFPDEYMGGEEGLAPIEEYDLGNGWTQSIFTATFPADGVTFVHIICHLDVVGDYLVDQIVVDMVIHDGDVPPMGPGRVGGAQPELASRPSPADAEEDVLPDNVLSWTPGDFAATHNVYFGTVFDDVNEADTNSALLVSPGQTDSAYVPAKILDWGQEYFWRVDEVNDADPNSPWKGDTWSFTVEPYTYALDPEEDQLLADDITVSSSEVDSWPDATIWDGLDGDEHSIEGWAMWLSGIDPDGAWIQYPFDKAYKLSEILIWNYNEDIEPILGFGFNETIIEYSTDEGETFVELATVNLNQAPGEPTGPTDILDLQGVVATNLRLTANSNFSGGFEEQFGLSAVRILYLPVRAMDPAPEPEEVVDLDDLVLQWRAGREATSHKVYFGNDPEDLALMETATETSYEPDGLAFDQEYFWRVDETDDPLLAGNVWSFITKDHLVVDDMEDYEDSADDPEVAVFGTWADGWLDPTNGSVVGDEFGATEKEITHDESDQSMPFSYDNTGDAVTSEATRTFDQAQDWTQFDIKALTFYVHGSEDNVGGQMYIKVNDVEQAVGVELAEASWQEVNIALADFAGVNLESVVSLTIGIGGANSSGTAYIDNIRLYPSRCLAETDLQGDVNGDCLVDEEDLAIITDNWLNTPMHAEYTFDADLS
ncbi:MAG: discoidin domain-containing protein, partial [Phycisphaerales bacterium]